MGIPFIAAVVDDFAHRFLSQNRAAGHYKLAGFLYCGSKSIKALFNDIVGDKS
jgi:hypothetical protein